MSRRWRIGIATAGYAVAGFVAATVTTKAEAYFGWSWFYTAITMLLVMFALVVGLERALRRLDTSRDWAGMKGGPLDRP